MNTPTFYEQVGIIIPGAVLLFGLLLFFPDLAKFMSTDAVSLGEFGIFFLLSYAAGHLVAAIGNVGEKAAWHFAGGMPSDWITKEQTALISPQQRERVEEKVRTRLGMDLTMLRGIEKRIWFPISRQIYADVMQHGKPDRIDTFNGNYGLNRGLASATLALVCVAISKHEYAIAVALGVAALVYAYRAYRFGVHYARELYVQFLAIEDAN